MPPLLPRFYAHQQQREDERKLAKILLETGGSLEEAEQANGKPRARSADGHDWARRRGLPLLGAGVGGTSPGTSPLGALLRKEANGERRR